MTRLTLFALCALTLCSLGAQQRPNIVLVMADDQGWGQVSYQNHPSLKTPNLDTMAAAGLRLDRFYAAGPVCSPTRASVLTARSPKRTGVPSHGHNLCLQEKTLPQALKTVGYVTGLFGKWHLNGVRGPGVPILADDANHPGHYGFDEWLSVTNFFDVNPLMSRNGVFEEFTGDSSVIIVNEALTFMRQQTAAETPFFAVIWYGSPHSPMRALDQDRGRLPDDQLGHHLGEIAGIDRSVGLLRKGLRDLGIERDTIVWYCSDNGGLAKIDPDACGGLKGRKTQVLEGGIRVPCIIEWPGTIQPAISNAPASTMDIMPTFVELLGLPESTMLAVRDGESILPLLKGKPFSRQRTIPFAFQKQAALIDGDFKVLSMNTNKASEWKLYNLKEDPGEANDLSQKLPERFEKMKEEAQAMLGSINASAAGKDYPEGRVVQPDRRDFWHQMDAYKPYFDMFFKRWEYEVVRKKTER